MDQQQTQAPEDVQQLVTFLQDLIRQRNALKEGTYPGKVVDDISKLSNFLSVSYQQVLNQYNNHPFIVEMKARQEAEQAAQKAAAEAAANAAAIDTTASQA